MPAATNADIIGAVAVAYSHPDRRGFSSRLSRYSLRTCSRTSGPRHWKERTLIEEARRRRRELPALLLTGYADAGVHLAVEDAETGYTALLRKPVSGTARAERAAALLAHAVAPQG